MDLGEYLKMQIFGHIATLLTGSRPHLFTDRLKYGLTMNAIMLLKMVRVRPSVDTSLLTRPRPHFFTDRRDILDIVSIWINNECY